MKKLVRSVVVIAAAGAAMGLAVFGLLAIATRAATSATSGVPKRIPPLSAALKEGSTVYAANGSVMSTFQGPLLRKPVRLSRVPKVLIHAVLDTEDHRFFQHGAIDIPSIFRALASDSSAGGGLQGGSTITQQLVKQVYLNSERKISRKIKEAAIAERLQKKYSKDQILDTYLNIIYLGDGAYGVQAAANAYWHEDVSKVTLPQAALLAGLIQDPTGYDPLISPVLARQRRGQVISRMLHYGTIDKAQAAAADAAPLPTVQPTKQPSPAEGQSGYYVANVEQQLLQPGGPLPGNANARYNDVFEGGLKIYTAYRPTAEAEALKAVRTITPPNTQGFEEALVATNPKNGGVEALVGGPGYNVSKSSFDVATQGGRQPGSGFKIFTLLAALKQGDSVLDTVNGHAPCAVGFPGNPGYVQHPAENDEGPGSGGVSSILTATAQSTNCAYLRLARVVGLSKVAAMAESMGIPASQLAPFPPSMVLGARPVSPLQMSAAYATLASGGTYHRPTFITRIVDRTGATIYKADTAGTRILSPLLVAEADAAFRAVVTSGTGVSAALPGRPLAGKTGTTSKTLPNGTSGPPDAWFNGYTPQLETTVWMGSPKGEIPMIGVGGVAEVYGATFPARTVQAFMSSVLANQPVLQFPTLNPRLLPKPKYISPPGEGPPPIQIHPPTTQPVGTTPTTVYIPPPSGPPTTTQGPPTTKPGGPPTTKPGGPPTTKPGGPPASVPSPLKGHVKRGDHSVARRVKS